MDYTVPLLWIHLSAIVTWIGLWFNTLLAFNSLRRFVPDSARASFISTLRKRYLTITWAAIAVFIVTGTILMETNENYPGFGHFFDNSWATLVVLKHIIVIIMLAVSFTLLYGILPRMATAIIGGDKLGEERLLRREKLAVAALATLGLAVLLIIVTVAELPESGETAALVGCLL
ncbi:CopD family protein [Dehalogenimonas etheniformans]|uniref:Copper resistance protein D domain-containing protein n=1 Tax=Dehalogenimonas etheniformans TaxID=1536648 RepID=A0A2P5P796_9CHLR|nr:CopD family protein [Dehalogenimonas etheniformans]PPD58155.1 hypothetical protein JP09_005015 [Dehalogenimonas etheniformans]QNT75564.1 CopD family protein [Dehalogenimonas etheniformans]